MGYRLINVSEPLAGQVQAVLGDPPATEVWLCTAAPAEVPAEVLVLGLDAAGPGIDLTVSTQDLSPGALARAVEWAQERRDLLRELEHERQRATEILATVSHEMRNPVTVLNFMAQLANDPRVKEEKKAGHLSTLQSTARSLLTLLNDVLDFARLGKGAVALSTSEFAVRKFVEDALIGQSLVAEDKALTLDWQVAPEVPESLVGDPGRLRQILNNLTGNAVKFTGQGAVRVEVGWRDPSELHLTVHDSGIGIAPAQLERIFEPYAQAAVSTTRKYGGTGLGLTITRQLIDLMGGGISVTSDEGKGSSFHVWVRLERPAVSTRQEVDEQRLQGLPVLVFSQNPGLRQSVDASGVAKTVAETPDQLLELGPSFGLAVFDLSLKGSEPFAWVARLRQRCPADQLRLIIYTSAGQRGDALRCQELGVSAYLTEPLEPQDWREALALTVAGTESSLITRHLLRERR